MMNSIRRNRQQLFVLFGGCVVVFCLMLTGCKSQQVVREDARDSVAAAQTLRAESNGVLAEAEKTRRNAAGIVKASKREKDPLMPEAVIIAIPTPERIAHEQGVMYIQMANRVSYAAAMASQAASSSATLEQREAAKALAAYYAALATDYMRLAEASFAESEGK